MKIKFLWLTLSCLLVLSLIFTSCGTKTTETTTSTSTTPTTKPTTTATVTTKITTTTTTTTGNWWDKLGVPQYGGVFNFRTTQDPRAFDSYYGRDDGVGHGLVLERLFMPNWLVDRAEYNYVGMYIPPKYWAGQLLESWEKPDLETIVGHVRQGVQWQDKAPVNGRELTAYDIEYNWHRQLGLGSGFTEPSPYIGAAAWRMVESVTATDKYTIVFKADKPTLAMEEVLICDETIMYQFAPEAQKQWGDLQDWRHLIGTGPYMLTNYVSGSSLTFKKNPNYWGYDERYPENRLPYFNEVKFLIIPDRATALAGLRSGKVDWVQDIPWDQAENLTQTNSELMQTNILADSAMGFQIRCDKTPFTDIRVRKALNMAIDRKTIAETYYGGVTEGIPYGLIGPNLPTLYTPFDQWPKEHQEGYIYNPAGAKKLLAEAGYPSGFKTNIVAGATHDLDLLQIVKSYFADVDIDMEIKVMDPVSVRAFTVDSRKHDQMAFYHTGAYGFPPNRSIVQRLSTHSTNMTYNNDPIFDDLYYKSQASLDFDEVEKLMKEADAYARTQHWVVTLLPTVTSIMYQPWVKGHSGETINNRMNHYLARFWIDQNLKK